MKRPWRSDAYQDRFNEVPWSYESLSVFSNRKSLQWKLNPFKYDEELLDAKDRLKERCYELMLDNATEHQMKLIQCLRKGLTQEEIANELKCHQTSVHKSIFGSAIYVKGKPPKKMGGIVHKMRLRIQEDPESQELIQKIAELTEEKQ